jgi:hypothetical protein
VDREHEPRAEARSRLARLIASNQESRLEQPFVIEAERVHVGSEQPDLARRPAKAESLRHLAGDAALLQICACRAPGVVLPEKPSIVLASGSDHLPDALARIGTLPARRVLGDVDADLLGDHAHRGGPLHAEALLEEGEDVPAGVADEAVVDPLLRRHREVALRSLMERARTAIIRADLLQ